MYFAISPQFIKTFSIFSILFFLIGCTARKESSLSSFQEGESIVYRIQPAGKSILQDRGLVELEGKVVRLIVFKTEVLGFSDTEKIYSDPETVLPVRVERDISMWLKKEKIIEEYDQEKYTLTVSKYHNNKKISEQKIEKDAPIHHAVLLFFMLRKENDFKAGWKFTVHLIDDFTLRFQKIETITVPAGSFSAYYFESTDNAFQVWMGVDSPRVPLKVKGLGKFGYTLDMKEYFIKQDD